MTGRFRMNFKLDYKDWIAIILIFLVSYWIAFRTKTAKRIANLLDKRKKPKKKRGEITGAAHVTSKTFGSFIKKSDLIVLYQGECAKSTRLANDFIEESELNCELCEADNYDFTVLEVLNLPVLFIVERIWDGLQEFLMKKEKDSKEIRAYTRRHLSNLKYAVVNAGDKAFAQFVDDGLEKLGAKRILALHSSGDMSDFPNKFSEILNKQN